MNFQDRRILVADDSTAALLLVEAYARQLGCSVKKVENGKLALDAMNLEVFDLVILDIRMPEMSGFEVLVAMRDLPAYHQVPVIIMSASTDTKDRADGLKLGASDYLSKPFAPEEIQARIRSNLGIVNLREQVEASRELYGDFIATLTAARKPGLGAEEILGLLEAMAQRHGLAGGGGHE